MPKVTQVVPGRLRFKRTTMLHCSPKKLTPPQSQAYGVGANIGPSGWRRLGLSAVTGEGETDVWRESLT